MTTYTENPLLRGDWIKRSYNNFLSQGFVLYPEQKQIYFHLARALQGKSIIEAGCGIGVGTGMLAHSSDVIGTDVSTPQILFAKELYPLCRFDVWDITTGPYSETADVVVAVEVIEHLGDYACALENLLATAPEVYLSTPNRNNPGLGQSQPHNLLHVREFTPEEFLELSAGRVKRILHWQTFEELDEDTEVTPVVYHLCSES